VTVVSASNTSEKLAEAPATVIVITRDDLAKRGYTELSQVLDDLPGMQVVRPYGATYLKNYWRGFRNTIGDPFLLLLDGVVLNHLYFNTADVLVTLPSRTSRASRWCTARPARSTARTRSWASST
jgi:outer membrane cobalamin receptor